jgi:uncharacterized protein (TIGR00251 family)
MSGGAGDIQIVEREGGVEFSVKVVPGSSRNKVVGIWGTALRIAVAAPPEGGRANKGVVRLLAVTFGVKPGSVAIVHGQTQPLKRVRIDAFSVEHTRQLLERLLGSAG